MHQSLGSLQKHVGRRKEGSCLLWSCSNRIKSVLFAFYHVIDGLKSSTGAICCILQKRVSKSERYGTRIKGSLKKGLDACVCVSARLGRRRKEKKKKERGKVREREREQRVCVCCGRKSIGGTTQRRSRGRRC